MLRKSSLSYNQYLQSPRIVNPSNQIHSGPKFFTDPLRLYQHKLLYHYLGLDSLPLRRVAIIRAEKSRMRMAPQQKFSSSNDPTGYRRSRSNQIALWYKRIFYQEWWIQNLYTRYAWGRCRIYPSNGGKIQGVFNNGVWGYDKTNLERYTRLPLPAQAREIYERRK